MSHKQLQGLCFVKSINRMQAETKKEKNCQNGIIIKRTNTDDITNDTTNNKQTNLNAVDIYTCSVNAKVSVKQNLLFQDNAVDYKLTYSLSKRFVL